ncbi:MAG TPA: hypothetical protein VG733_15735, partial [Chthoniobacteraceae bacterium]|nr:hypothetical protein [Chthoniobacteraceae bacterium]
CLVPLGKPAANAPKYFAAVDVLKLAQDREWLSRATRTISKFWSEKNSRKKPSRKHGDHAGTETAQA